MSDDIEEWIDETDGMSREEDPEGSTLDIIGGGWNYRLIRRQTEHGEKIAIHEVYYNSQDEPRSCTKNPVPVAGEDIEVLKKDVEMMKQAFEKPVLDYEDF